MSTDELLSLWKRIKSFSWKPSAKSLHQQITQILSCLLNYVPHVLLCSTCLVPCVLLHLMCLVLCVLLCPTYRVEYVLSGALCPMHTRALWAIFPYVPLAHRTLRFPCDNITFCALEFPCLTMLLFCSFPNVFFMGIY